MEEILQINNIIIISGLHFNEVKKRGLLRKSKIGRIFWVRIQWNKVIRNFLCHNVKQRYLTHERSLDLSWNFEVFFNKYCHISTVWTGTVEFHRYVHSVFLIVLLSDIWKLPGFEYISMDDSFKQSVNFL
jgi:hypothetical protein